MEPMNVPVYLITCGEYSDYGVVRVYLDKEEAERVVEAHNKVERRSWNTWEIEEWTTGVQQEFDGMVYVGEWTRRLNWSTKVPEEETVLPTDERYGRTWHTGAAVGEAKVIFRNDITNPSRLPLDQRHFSVRVLGTNADKVTKVLHDEIAMIKAQIAEVSQ